MTRYRRCALLLAALPLAAACLHPAAAQPTTFRASVASDGTQGNGGSPNASISADGRYAAFSSDAANLVPFDTNGVSDVFVHDHQTGNTTRVSVASDGTPGNNTSFNASISGDGRYVAFDSWADNLVPGDTNGQGDVFVHDRLTGVTSRTSVASGGAQAHGWSRVPSLSSDGRYVAFFSWAPDLVSGDTNGQNDVFIHDRQTGATTRISVASDGTQGNNTSYNACVSADGRFVAFQSMASNLVASDTNRGDDVFVRDRLSGATTCVSIASDGTQGNGDSLNPSISSDGRYVAFGSWASNLVAGDTNGISDVFVHDRATGITTRASVASSGTQANGRAETASLSADGRSVAFCSFASNLVAGDTNSKADIFIRDLQTAQTTRASVALDSSQGNGESYLPSISADGQYAAFVSESTNLVENDTNAAPDVFVRGPFTGTAQRLAFSVQPVGADPGSALGKQPTVIATDNAGSLCTAYTGPVTLSIKPGTGKAGAVLSGVPTINAVAGTAAFTGLSIDRCGLGYVLIATGEALVPAESEAFDCPTGAAMTFRGSIASDGTQGDGGSPYASVSDDGRFVAFSSDATNLVPSDTNEASDVFVHDHQTGATVRVSVAPAGTQGDLGSYYPSITPDGRYVTFWADATNLVPDDTNYSRDVFVHDRQTGTTVRASVASDGTQGDASSYWPAISPDGRYVAFYSFASTLIANDTNDEADVFVRDLQTGLTTRVSVASDGTQGNGLSANVSISADGRWVAFKSEASNLVAEDTNEQGDVFLHDRQTGATSRVSVASNGAQGNGGSNYPSLSAAGRYVAFESDASDLVAGDTNGRGDVFVRDLHAGLTTRVSVATDGTQANGSSGSASMSSDGRYVAFSSGASNLVASDTNGQGDVFVHDRQTGVTVRASAASDGGQGDGESVAHWHSLSASGKWIAFASSASNLVPNDTNNARDVFVRGPLTGIAQLRSAEFATQPTGARPGAPMSVQPVVRVIDACGETDTTYGGTVTLTIKPGTGAEGAVLSGFTDVHAIAGVVDYIGLSIDRCGMGYVLIATGESLSPAESAPFDCAPVTVGTVRVSLASDGTQGNLTSPLGSLGADGRYVAFSSYASNLVPSDTNGARDVFVLDRQTGSTTRVSVASGGTQANLGSDYPVITPNGRYVAFQSDASNLVSGDTNAKSDVFVHDRNSGRTERVSRGTYGTQGNGASYHASVTPDGRYAAFWSVATDLVDEDTNGQYDAFVRDLQAGVTTRVSVASDGTQGNGMSTYIVLSADGRYAAFESYASNLVAGDSNGTSDVFVRDLQTGLTTLVSVASDGAQGNGRSMSASITPDGQCVAFQSDASNLVAGDTNGKGDVFVRELQTGVTSRVSVASDGTQANLASSLPALSADGRYVAFDSDATNLVTGDTNNARDVFVHDRQTGMTVRASVAADAAQGNGLSSNGAISADGQYICFGSDAPNLVASDTNGVRDVFIRGPLIGGVPLRRLAFGTQPGGAHSGVPMAPQPVAIVVDACGDTATSYTGAVTLAIRPGTGAVGAVLSGVTTVNAISGVAVFAGLSIDRPGKGYMLRASGQSLAGADSAAFDIEPSAYTFAEAVECLRVAGGLEAVPVDALSRLDLDSNNKVDLADSALIARKLAGLEPNP